MERYIGVKEIKARPMNRKEYNDYRGWICPANENGADEGMLVEYLDAGQQNHEDHEGYISWSPKDVFSKAYYRIKETDREPILKYFEYTHLPERLQTVSKPFCLIANVIMSTSPASAEKTVALRKLLESKDAAVRAAL